LYFNYTTPDSTAGAMLNGAALGGKEWNQWTNAEGGENVLIALASQFLLHRAAADALRMPVLLTVARSDPGRDGVRGSGEM
jgi:hypothetical protein